MACLVRPLVQSRLFTTANRQGLLQESSSINHRRAFYPLGGTLEISTTPKLLGSVVGLSIRLMPPLPGDAT